MIEQSGEQRQASMELFYELLYKQFALYEHMSVLYVHEKEYIQSGDVVRLQESLEKKDMYLNDVVVIEKELAPLKEEWSRCKTLVSPNMQLKIQSLIDKFKILVKKLVACQKENEETLIEMNKKKAEELALVRKGKQVGKAYSVYGETIPRSKYMDKSR